MEDDGLVAYADNAVAGKGLLVMFDVDCLVLVV